MLQPNVDNLQNICFSCVIELERAELLWKIYKLTLIQNIFGDCHKKNHDNFVSMKTNDYLMAVGNDELQSFNTNIKETTEVFAMRETSDEILKTPQIKTKSRRSELHPKIPSKCPHCGKLIKNMARHIKEIHERKDASKCHMCLREFARKSSLKDHIRSAHKS